MDPGPSSCPIKLVTMTTTDLRTDLDLHRLGEEFYLQALDQLSARQLAEPSLLPGWTRKHVAVHMTANAEAIMRGLEWARTGVETPMYPSREWRDKQIAEMVTEVSDDDVRAIAHEVAEEIREEFAAMPAEAWEAEVRNGQGQPIPAKAYVWMRAREAWIHSLDLNIGMTTRDFPATVVDRLIDDVEQVWTARGERAHFHLHFTDRDGQTRTIGNTEAGDPVEVTGEAAEIVSYLLGRGWPRSSADSTDKGGAGTPQDLPDPPAWL